MTPDRSRCSTRLLDARRRDDVLVFDVGAGRQAPSNEPTSLSKCWAKTRRGKGAKRAAQAGSECGYACAELAGETWAVTAKVFAYADGREASAASVHRPTLSRVTGSDGRSWLAGCRLDRLPRALWLQWLVSARRLRLRGQPRVRTKQRAHRIPFDPLEPSAAN
jgi:hypothetical protein